ncbi:unnamed protein product [Paramecium sonneborni]|uniref:Uncharacterized protein n=1 Tax=Paramecium sonneborni TaxID=65129 RepID=A0A8S1LCH4_9CILI|nr:unnamed protein product [Paramecium sonneborni]
MDRISIIMDSQSTDLQKIKLQKEFALRLRKNHYFDIGIQDYRIKNWHYLLESLKKKIYFF